MTINQSVNAIDRASCGGQQQQQTEQSSSPTVSIACFDPSRVTTVRPILLPNSITPFDKGRLCPCLCLRLNKQQRTTKHARLLFRQPHQGRDRTRRPAPMRVREWEWRGVQSYWSAARERERDRDTGGGTSKRWHSPRSVRRHQRTKDQTDQTKAPSRSLPLSLPLFLSSSFLPLCTQASSFCFLSLSRSLIHPSIYPTHLHSVLP